VPIGRPDEPLQGVVDDLVEDLPLALEVVVDRAVAGAHLGGDVADGVAW